MKDERLPSPHLELDEQRGRLPARRPKRGTKQPADAPAWPSMLGFGLCVTEASPIG